MPTVALGCKLQFGTGIKMCREGYDQVVVEECAGMCVVLIGEKDPILLDQYLIDC